MTLDDLVLGIHVTLVRHVPSSSFTSSSYRPTLTSTCPTKLVERLEVQKDSTDEGLLRTEGCRTNTEAVWAKQMLYPLDH